MMRHIATTLAALVATTLLTAAPAAATEEPDAAEEPTVVAETFHKNTKCNRKGRTVIRLVVKDYYYGDFRPIAANIRTYGGRKTYRTVDTYRSPRLVVKFRLRTGEAAQVTVIRGHRRLISDDRFRAVNCVKVNPTY